MIYFIQCGEKGPIKIGRSGRPHVRLRALQNGNPYQLYIRKIIERKDERTVERGLILSFRHYRIHYEWFEPTSELLTMIDDFVGPDNWEADFEVHELHPILGKTRKHQIIEDMQAQNELARHRPGDQGGED